MEALQAPHADTRSTPRLGTLPAGLSGEVWAPGLSPSFSTLPHSTPQQPVTRAPGRHHNQRQRRIPQLFAVGTGERRREPMQYQVPSLHPIQGFTPSLCPGQGHAFTPPLQPCMPAHARLASARFCVHHTTQVGASALGLGCTHETRHTPLCPFARGPSERLHSVKDHSFCYPEQLSSCGAATRSAPERFCGKRAAWPLLLASVPREAGAPPLLAACGPLHSVIAVASCVVPRASMCGQPRGCTLLCSRRVCQRGARTYVADRMDRQLLCGGHSIGASVSGLQYASDPTGYCKGSSSWKLGANTAPLTLGWGIGMGCTAGM